MDLEVETRRIEIDVVSTRDAIHDVEEREFTLTCDAVVVVDFQQRKRRPPTVGDKHGAITSRALGRGHVTSEVAAGKRMNSYDDLPSRINVCMLRQIRL